MRKLSTRVFFLTGIFLLSCSLLQNVGAESHDFDEEEEELLSVFKLVGPYDVAEVLDEEVEGVEIVKWVIETEKNGDYKKAAGIYTKMALIAELAFGPGHPDIMVVLTHKLRALSMAQEWDEALAVAKNMYRVQEETFGNEHESTIQAMSNLGAVYSEKKEYETAEKLLKEALHLAESKLGQNHTVTIQTLFNLADVYLDGKLADKRDKYDLAVDYFLTVYNFRSADPTLGKEHEKTVVARERAAIVLAKMGRFNDAVELLEQVFQVRTKTLGEDHPRTEATRNGLLMFERLGDADENKLRKFRTKEDQKMYDEAYQDMLKYNMKMQRMEL